MVEKTFKSIEQIFHGGTLFNLANTLIAIIGIILSIYFYRKSVIRKKPVYLSRNFNLVKNGVEKFKSVSIMHRDQRVSNLSVSRVALWNEGKQTIDKNDIVVKDPIRITVSEGLQILDVEIIAQNQKTNNFQITLNAKGKYATITFDFFDQNQGIVIQVLHTGTSSRDICVTGTIKGFGQIKKLDRFPKLLKILNVSKFFDRIKPRHKQVASGITALIMIAFIWIIQILSKNRPGISHPSGINLASPVIISIMYAWIAWMTLLPKVPKGLDIFYDESV